VDCWGFRRLVRGLQRRLRFGKIISNSGMKPVNDVQQTIGSEYMCVSTIQYIFLMLFRSYEMQTVNFGLFRHIHITGNTCFIC
jgi:hypothetical protein